MFDWRLQVMCRVLQNKPGNSEQNKPGHSDIRR
jgi:hypothetical protein